MKRVLITGAGSYVGGWVRKRLEREPERFYVEELDVQDDAWRSCGYDLLPRGKVLLDMEYIEHRSVRMDVSIILKTLGVVSTGEGAR